MYPAYNSEFEINSFYTHIIKMRILYSVITFFPFSLIARLCVCVSLFLSFF
jgi:hypothetical protein